MRTLSQKTLLLAAAALLFACGRPNNSHRFVLDGVGDPGAPVGNVVPGAWAGDFEVTHWNAGYNGPLYGGLGNVRWMDLFGGAPDYPAIAGLFNATAIEGLAGLPLLVINVPPPSRDPVAVPCYFDLSSPELGGNIMSVDVGFQVNFLFAGHTTPLPVTRASSSTYTDPLANPVFYTYVPPQPPNPLPFLYDETFEAGWGGGSLDGAGYPIAPARSSSLNVGHVPPQLAPRVNGTSLSGVTPALTLANNATYTITWTPAPTPVVTPVAPLVDSVQVSVAIYGPANLPPQGAPPTVVNNLDIPFFNTLGQLVCSAPDSVGQIVIKQSDLDSLVSLVKQTRSYAVSTEDPYHCGVGCTGVDGNHNNRIDKIYGAAMTIARHYESSFSPCLSGADAVSSCDYSAPVFVQANAAWYARLGYVQAQ